METQNLLGKRVISIGDDSKGMHGILVKITNGRYPFIVEFDSGSCYGVTEVTLEKSDREQAIEWWNNLESDKRNLIYMNYMGTLNSGRSLKTYEIEQIWRKEMFALSKEQRHQIDFEMLKRYYFKQWD